MSRFLIVVPPLLGHVNPTVGIGQIMRERGHQVAWTGPALTLRPLLGNDAQIYPTGMRAIREQAEHGLASIKSVWEGFIVPYARFTLPALDKAVLDYSPDVIIVDQHSPAGALVAHRHGVRWVSLTSSAMEISRPFITLPKVEAWIHEKLVGLWQHAGLPEQEFIDPRFSPELVISLSSPALTGAATFPDHYAFTGPILAEPDQLSPSRSGCVRGARP